MNFMVYELYLNKAVIKKRKQLPGNPLLFIAMFLKIFYQSTSNTGEVIVPTGLEIGLNRLK